MVDPIEKTPKWSRHFLGDESDRGGDRGHARGYNVHDRGHNSSDRGDRGHDRDYDLSRY